MCFRGSLLHKVNERKESSERRLYIANNLAWQKFPVPSVCIVSKERATLGQKGDFAQMLPSLSCVNYVCD